MSDDILKEMQSAVDDIRSANIHNSKGLRYTKHEVKIMGFCLKLDNRIILLSKQELN